MVDALASLSLSQVGEVGGGAFASVPLLREMEGRASVERGRNRTFWKKETDNSYSFKRQGSLVDEINCEAEDLDVIGKSFSVLTKEMDT